MMNDAPTHEHRDTGTDARATIDADAPEHEWRHRHHHRRHGCGHRRDLSTLSGPQRLAHRFSRLTGGLVFLAVKVTILALVLAGIVSAWRWIFDVLA